MTREETKTILKICKAEWPHSFRGMSREDAEAKVELWAAMFAEDDPRIVGAAVKALIVSNREFAPGVGQVKEKMRELTAPREMNEADAWARLAAAIRNSGYEAAQEFEQLPPILRRIAGSPAQLKEWSLMDSETLHSVVASNVQRSFRAISARERIEATLPADVRETIRAVTGGERPALSEAETEPALPDAANEPEQEPEQEGPAAKAPDWLAEYLVAHTERVSTWRDKKPKRHTEAEQAVIDARRTAMIAALKGGGT